MSYEIVKDKSLPAGMRGAAKYPFKDMEIGDAFCVGDSDRLTRNRVTSAYHSHSRRHGGTFATRAEDGKLWCWRTA